MTCASSEDSMDTTYSKGETVELRVLNFSTDPDAPLHEWASGTIVKIDRGKATVQVNSWRCRVALDSPSLRKVAK
jgi:exosome complex RNA-binding protein Rrp4